MSKCEALAMVTSWAKAIRKSPLPECEKYGLAAQGRASLIIRLKRWVVIRLCFFLENSIGSKNHC